MSDLNRSYYYMKYDWLWYNNAVYLSVTLCTVAFRAIWGLKDCTVVILEGHFLFTFSDKLDVRSIV